MDNRQKSLDEIVTDLERSEKKYRFKYIIIFSLVTLFGVLLIFWNVRQSKDIEIKNQGLVALKDSVKATNLLLDTISSQLNNSRAANEKLSEGVKYATSNRSTNAILSYTKAIELDPKNAVAYDLRGYLYFKKKDNKKAINDLEYSIALDSNYVWGHYNLALAYMADNDTIHALNEVKKVLEIDPTFSEIIMDDGQFKNFKKVKGFNLLINQH